MSRCNPIIAAALAAAALAAFTAPTALADPWAVDPMRTPVEATQDLRSPDARDAAARHQSPTSLAAARAQERYYTSYGAPADAPATAIAARDATSSGFDWNAAVAGACAALAVVALVTAAALIVTRRRGNRDQPAAAA